MAEAKPKRNFLEERLKDGQDRSHIPPISMKLVWLRITQITLAVVYLVLAAFAAYTLNTSNVSCPYLVEIILSNHAHSLHH
jgi:hypothetical protein